MIPIINVIFLLLIFFLMQGSFKQNDPVAVEIPSSTHGQPVGADAAQIFLTSTGVSIGDKPVDDATLKNDLEEMAKENPGRKLLLKADSNTDSTRLIEILKIVKQAGLENLYMVTTSEGKE